MRYIITLILLSSCLATPGVNKQTCRQLTNKIELCEDLVYNKLGAGVKFCRIVIDRGFHGHTTITDKFRCEDL